MNIIRKGQIRRLPKADILGQAQFIDPRSASHPDLTETCGHFKPRQSILTLFATLTAKLVAAAQPKPTISRTCECCSTASSINAATARNDIENARSGRESREPR